MKRLVVVAAAVAAIAALVFPVAALASTTQVSAFGCQNHGGQANVPADRDVVVRQALVFKNLGLTQNYLHAQTSSLSVNGAAAADVSGLWVAPFATSGAWQTTLLYPTGITLAAGQSMTFHLVVSLSHPSVDGLSFENGVSGKPVFFGPGPTFDLGVCTVTGV